MVALEQGFDDVTHADSLNRPSFTSTGTPEPSLGDTRFRRLLTANDWAALPEGTRRRFSHRKVAGKATIYRGYVSMLRTSWAGRLLARLLIPIGAPLPTPNTGKSGLPSVVTVTEGADGETQHWTRLFATTDGFPQLIRSAKHFRGQTGLEEAIGWGITIALKVDVIERVLTFTGVAYAVRVGRIRMPLPCWLVPGHLTVTHRDLSGSHGDGAFAFGLDLTHAWLGCLIHQTAIYREVPDGE
ncbi:MAG: DUF4166 domain-containing protein [Pseudomonadota bacterium]